MAKHPTPFTRSPKSPGRARRLRGEETSAPRLGPLGRLSHWSGLTRLIWSYGRPHRRLFLFGAAFALAVVAFRLALPWTLKAALRPWLKSGPGKGEHTMPGGTLWSHAAAMAGVFLVLLLALGLADLLERLYFAKFSIGTVRDLRAAAFGRAVATGEVSGSVRSGDLIARLIGDTTRIKAGMKGFLVHVATNGVLYLGTIGMLLWMSPLLGAVFGAAGVLLLVATYLGAVRMYDRAARYRSKEGRLANSIHHAWTDDGVEATFARVNRSSGTQEAKLTKIQGVTTLCAHAIFGLAVVGAFWIGLASSAGRLDRGEMIVFVLYAISLRAPVVQLARQGTRTGKILACVERLDHLLKRTNAPGGASLPASLSDRIVLEGVRARSGRSHGRRRKLGPITLEIPAGQHVAVVGPPGSGKTTLLRLVSGLENARGGSVRWDSTPLPLLTRMAWSARALGYLPERPSWRRAPLRAFLGVKGDLPEAAVELLEGSGADRVIRRLHDGLETKIGSQDLSIGECRGLFLLRVVLAEPSVLLLDDAAGALSEEHAARLVKRVLRGCAGRTVVMTLTRPAEVGEFDRVIELKKGRVVFDGPPLMWHERGSSDIPQVAAGADAGREDENEERSACKP